MPLNFEIHCLSIYDQSIIKFLHIESILLNICCEWQGLCFMQKSVSQLLTSISSTLSELQEYVFTFFTFTCHFSIIRSLANLNALIMPFLFSSKCLTYLLNKQWLICHTIAQLCIYYGSIFVNYKHWQSKFRILIFISTQI